MSALERKKDPLAAAKLDKAGESLANPREQIVTLVAAARELFPHGPPEGTTFYGMPRERMNAAANGYGLGSITSLASEDELRLLLHVAHDKRMADMMPPGHHQGEGFRGPMAGSDLPLPEKADRTAPAPASEAKVWRALAGKRCSLNGQMFWVERGSIIRERDYTPNGVQLMVKSGLVLEDVTAEFYAGTLY